VHDAGARQARGAAVVRQQGIEQGARPVARGGVHHHAGGLVHHHQVYVFMNHDDRQSLGPERAALGRGHQLDLDALARAHLARGGCQHRTVHAHMPLLDQRLQVAARKLLGHRDHGLVQPLAMKRRRHDGRATLRRIVPGCVGGLRFKFGRRLKGGLQFGVRHGLNPIIALHFYRTVLHRQRPHAWFRF
jgi:hypothetical protein